MANFNKAIEKVLRWEGGEVNDPRDPGGHTRYGISKRAFPDEDIANLTLARAKHLYRIHYWIPLGLDLVFSQEKAEVLLDFGVNAGVTRASKIAQEVLRVTVDGVVGPQTLRVLNGSPNFTSAFTIARISYYTRLAEKRPSMRAFHFGWVRRALSFT